MTTREVTIPEGVSSMVASMLVACEYVKVGDWELTTGRRAPFYIDLRELSAEPAVNVAICTELLKVASQLEAEALMGIPDASNLIAMTTALMGKKLPLPVLRMSKVVSGEEPKLFGITVIPKGSRVVVIDDVITDGGSKIKVVNKLRELGYHVEAIVVVVDRCEGGIAYLASKLSVSVFALCTIRHILTQLELQEKLTKEKRGEIEEYLRKASFAPADTSS